MEQGQNKHLIVSVKGVAMFHYFSVIREVFATLRLAFGGELIEPSSPDIKNMISEAYDLNIPQPKQDRLNLNKDGNAVVSDYNKAFSQKQLELAP